MLRRLTALAMLLVPAACSTYGSQAAGHAYYSGRTEDARQQLEALLEKDADSRALYLDELGVLALDSGDLDGAYRHFFEANQIMEAFEGANLKEVGAILGKESSKIWRGDPYEKSMNSYYMGVIGLLRHNDDNARAGFKNAIFLDSSRGEEQYQCDFAPAIYLEGFASGRLGDSTVAEADFARARELVPGCSAFREEAKGNVLVIVDVGRGPTKIAAGEHGEAVRYVDHPERPSRVDVVADGSVVGATEKAGDVYFQATTRGGRAFDAVLRGKAIYKSAARDAGIGALVFADDLPKKYQTGALIAGAGLLLSSFAVSAEADTRHWTTLPAEVQLFRGTLTPGSHVIQVVPSFGRIAGSDRQTIEVPEQGDVVVYARVLP